MMGCFLLFNPFIVGVDPENIDSSQRQYVRAAANKGAADGSKTTKNAHPEIPRASMTVPMHYESGSHHVYIYVGSPKPQRQTLILDTGSRYMAFPCEPCPKCGRHASKFYFNDTQSTTHRDNYHPNCVFAKKPKKDSKDNACVFEQTYLEGSSWYAKEVEDLIWLATADEEESIDEYMPHLAIPFTFGCQTHVTGYFVHQVSKKGVKCTGQSNDCSLICLEGLRPYSFVLFDFFCSPSCFVL